MKLLIEVRLKLTRFAAEKFCAKHGLLFGLNSDKESQLAVKLMQLYGALGFDSYMRSYNNYFIIMLQGANKYGHLQLISNKEVFVTVLQ
jgi:peroxiredoxin